jgi:hypothetical protein
MKSTSGGTTERSTFCKTSLLCEGGETERGCLEQEVCLLMNRSNKSPSSPFARS